MKSWWTRISVGMLTLLGIVVLASCTSLGTVGVPSLGGVAQERRSQGSGVGVAEGESGPGEESVGFSKRGWRTDFSKRNVSLSEIKGGGPPKDGIPPIDKPKFVDAQQAGAWLGEKEPVGYLNLGGEAKAYPLQILTWHEIVNDTVGGQPVSMTFCPLCNTVLAFDRRLDGRFLDFGTTGNLRLSDLVMYDRQTESWWQQAVGEAIIGELTGKKLVFLPAGVISFREFREAFPKGLVLSRDTGFDRDYGRNPYAGYDSRNNTPFLFFGSLDRRALPMERVVAVSIGSEDVAYTFTFLEKNRVVNDTI
ncbi:MAG: hypothetical protein HW403_1283, partial [Dehalococcoidia bacterium]|nr:hypothetical protein [Dehalococcoidia bacterium]